MSNQDDSSSLDGSVLEIYFKKFLDESHLNPDPVVFLSFPSKPICDCNLDVLKNTAFILSTASGTELDATLSFCTAVLLNDFPPEIFLQHPAVLEALCSRMVTPTITSNEDNWRVQENSCKSVLNYTRLLSIRLDDYISNHVISNLNIPSNGSKVQSHVVRWCTTLLNAVLPLLSSAHIRLATAAYQLADVTLKIFSQCVDVQTLIIKVSKTTAKSLSQFLSSIFALICQVVSHLSEDINMLYEASKPVTKMDYIASFIMKQNLINLFISIIKMITPTSAAKLIFSDSEMLTIRLLLFDACFYHQCPAEYSLVLKFLRAVDVESADQFIGLSSATDKLKSLITFLQISSSDIDSFQKEANECIEILPVHQSRVYIEKLIRGLAKQCSLRTIEDHQRIMAVSLLLKVINCPQLQCQLISFRCVHRYLLEVLGIHQTTTSLDQSRKCLLFLTESVLNCIIFHGCVSEHIEVREISKNVLITIIRGEKMMNCEVKSKAFKVLSSCLHSIQLLTSSNSVLGLAVLDLHNLLSLHNEVSKFQCFKFHIQNMFSRDSRTVRETAFRNMLAILSTNSDQFVGPKISSLDIENDAHMFITTKQTDIFSAVNSTSVDDANLAKVVRILNSNHIDPSVTTSAWKQLSFLLQSYKLHGGLERMLPFSRIVNYFFTMMQCPLDGSMIVSQAPYALEVIRLCVTFSTFHRSFLSDDWTFWVALGKAALLFREDHFILREISLIFSLLLYDELLSDKGDGSSKTISLPTLVSKCQYVPFAHQKYTWDMPFYSKDKSPLRALNEASAQAYITFLKEIWNLYFCRPDQHQSQGNVPLSKTFCLTDEEAFALQYRQAKVVAGDLLTGVVSSTSHKDVKRSLNQLENVIAQIMPPGCFDTVAKLNWIEAVSRFLLILPSSPLDYQIMLHLMNLLHKYMLALHTFSKHEPNKSSRRINALVSLIASECSKEDSAILLVIRKTGTVDWNKSNHTAAIVQSVSLFTSVLNMINVLILLHDRVYIKEMDTDGNSTRLQENVLSVLLDVLRHCVQVPNLNLPVLVPTLQLITTITKNFELDKEAAFGCVVSLKCLIVRFEEQRSYLADDFLGRAVIVRVLLILSALLSSNNVYGEEDPFSLLCDSSPIISWMLATLTQQDEQLIIAGLKLASSFLSSGAGAEALYYPHHSNDQLWLVALRLLINADMDSSVRNSSCQLLINHTSYLATGQGEVIQLGAQAFLDALTKCEFCVCLRKLFRFIKPTLSESLPPDDDELHSEQLRDFITLEESYWVNTLDTVDDESIAIEVKSDLIEYSICLITNCLMLDYDRVLAEFKSSLAINLLVRQLAALEGEVCLSTQWNGVIEAAFKLLIFIDGQESTNTYLAPLAIECFISCGEPNSVTFTALKILSGMLKPEGWGSWRILELLMHNRHSFVPNMLLFLHREVRPEWRQSAICFFTFLCKSDIDGEHFSYVSSLSQFFQSKIDFYGKKSEAIAWELTEHFLQLLPSVADLKQMKWRYGKDEDFTTLNLLLTTLSKIVVFHDAKTKAIHCSELLLLLQSSLELLWEKVMKININIASNILCNKEIKSYVDFAILGLDVATNLMYCPNTNSDPSNEQDVMAEEPLVTIGEMLLPFVHRLWTPALKCVPLMQSLVQFLTTASSVSKVCPIFTKTYSLPGLALSSMRTSRSLLVCIVALTCQRIDRHCREKPNQANLNPQQFLSDCLILILNLSSNRETSAVIVKEGFISTALKYLSWTKNGKNERSVKLIEIVACLTSHPEGRAALEKYPNWSKILSSFCSDGPCCDLCLIVYLNMINNSQSVKSMLSTDEFIDEIAELLPPTLEKMSQNEKPLYLPLACLWSLCANNQKAKSIVKKANLLPVFTALMANQNYAQLCHQITYLCN